MFIKIPKLKSRVATVARLLPLHPPQVAGLWQLALQSQFEPEELESLREELVSPTSLHPATTPRCTTRAGWRRCTS